MEKIEAALSAAVRLARLNLQKHAPEMTSTQVISCAALLPAWAQGPYTAGQVVSHNGQPWRCLQAHDSSGDAAWAPGVAPSLWGPYHSRSYRWALPWIAPTGAQDAYQTGEYMVWTDGQVWLCCQDATVHGPDLLPQAWAAQP